LIDTYTLEIMNSLFITLLVSCLIAYAIAECPSACSGHGTCGAYDACTCFRNWMSNDCSERICPFGNAHVDTPLGDLDSSSGRLTGPNTRVIVNDAMYPQGTYEQFPSMKDSQGNTLSNTAHYYRECSNKGICDRSTGTCECFEGYDGSSCQRASCPTSSAGVCSGHGTCASIQELAAMDHENIYRLWDEDITMGCACDAGYTGSDCAARACKVGADPLYYDDFQNVRHANFTVQFYIMNDDAEIYGNYSIVFTDVYGEDWQTVPIDIDANCGVIQSALEGLPNDVVPTGSVLCQKHDADGSVNGERLHTVSDLSLQDTAYAVTIAAPSAAHTINLNLVANTPATTTGSGTGAELRISTNNDGTVTKVVFTNAGIGYNVGDTLTITEGGQTTVVTLTAVGSADSNSHTGQVRPSAADGTADAATGQYHSGENQAPIYWARTTNNYRAYNYSVVNKFTLAFPGNPGSIAPLKINRYLDGKRPTLFSTESQAQNGYHGETLGVHIYSNGFHGEETDYVNDECEGVLVGLASDQYAASGLATKKWTQYLAFDDDLQFQRLKRCLGDADGISTNNVDVYDWDFGNFMNPHLIKLVDATQDRFTEFIRADGTSYKVLASGQTPSGGGSGSIDRNQNGVADAWETNVWDAVPMTKLCNNQKNWVNDNYLASGNQFPLKFQNTDGLGALNLGERGWCRNYNPPGFFAIVYFDDCTANGVVRKHAVANTFPAGTPPANDLATYEMCGIGKSGFRLLTRPAMDYKTTTRFHVYTTKGTLQQVSQHASAHTTTYEEMFDEGDGLAGTAVGGVSKNNHHINQNFIHGFYSNVIHTRNTTYRGGVGAIDCETAPVGSAYGNFDCLNKGDKLFLVNLGVRNAAKCDATRTEKTIAGGVVDAANNCFYETNKASFNSNPMYPNMYTVMKIGKESKNGLKSESLDTIYNRFSTTVSGNSPSSNQLNVLPSDGEGYRHTITLDMGVNAMYIANSKTQRLGNAGDDNSATMYKFYPPTLASTGSTGYNYVAQCSNRGICDSDTGICECFTGYTGQACDQVNSLAQ